MSDQLQRGRFIWRDLITGNPDTAEAFYTNLFGWQAIPIDQGEAGVYRMLMQNGTPFGGIYGAEPTGWVSYIITPDLDQTLKQIDESGETAVSELMELPNVGRFAVIDDPGGARFAAMETALPGTDPAATPEVGGIAFNELVTSDFEGSIAFYSQVFGYGEMPVPSAAGNYSLLTTNIDGNPVMMAGVFRRPEGIEQNAWIIYVGI